LIYLGTAGLPERPPQTIGVAQNLIAVVAGIFLLAGLWTPLMGTLVALDEIWIALSFYSPAHGDTRIHVFLAVLAVGVAMLGPGAWSIDARLFGRKRFDIDPARGRRSSH
jgi:putative oxidoreductase